MDVRKMLVAAAALAVTSSAVGLPGEPPPPPPDLNECSPGFWKNHTELWFGFYCTSDEACDDLLADLKLRGPGSGEIRQAVASHLNAWADSYYGQDLCPNDY